MKRSKHTDKNGTFRSKQSARPFEKLVALEVRQVGTRIERRFGLSLCLEIEEHRLQIPERPSWTQRLGLGSPLRLGEDDFIQLRVRLKHCYVRYRCKQIDIVVSSKSEQLISDKFLKARTSEKKRRQSGNTTKVDLETEVKSEIPSLPLKLSAIGKFGRSRQVTSDVESQSVAQLEIYHVQAVPDGWRIGDPHFGDPTSSSPHHWLDGRYFASPEVELPGTCEAEFRLGYDRGNIIFAVTVHDGLHIERINGRSATDDERTSAKDKMRNRIASIALERFLGQNRKSHDFGDEMPLAIVRCDVAVAASDCDKDPLSKLAGNAGLIKSPPKNPSNRRTKS